MAAGTLPHSLHVCSPCNVCCVGAGCRERKRAELGEKRKGEKRNVANPFICLSPRVCVCACVRVCACVCPALVAVPLPAPSAPPPFPAVAHALKGGEEGREGASGKRPKKTQKRTSLKTQRRTRTRTQHMGEHRNTTNAKKGGEKAS